VIDGMDPVWTPPAPLDAKKRVNTLNKSDIAGQVRRPVQSGDVVPISAKTGEGLEALISRLEEIARSEIAPPGDAAITRTRHRVELVSSRDALKRFVNHNLAPELKAEELRIAARHLGRLTGLIDVEEVLGAIFSEFCIGK
jgi:tRNA modification GTPase